MVCFKPYPSKKFLRKILGQDGQDLAQEAKILTRRPNLAQNLGQDLRQDPGQDFVILASWTRSWQVYIWGRGGKSWASLGQDRLPKNFLLGMAIAAINKPFII